MTTLIDFNTAKLLKEKGFGCNTKNYYTPNSEKLVYGLDSVIASIRIKAPTIAEVVMWLYEKHGIWISVSSSPNFKTFSAYVVHKKKGGWDSKEFNSPTEAYQEAISYCLTKLI